jgi:hypothetical protein
MENLKVGDILIDKEGRERKVLSVAHDNHDVILLSSYFAFNNDGVGDWYTKGEIVRVHGLKLKSNKHIQ